MEDINPHKIVLIPWPGKSFKIELRQLTVYDARIGMLKHINRHQKIEKMWTYDEVQNYNKLVDCDIIYDWTEQERLEREIYLVDALIHNKGWAFGAFDGEKLMGYILANKRLFGDCNEYVELRWFYVSEAYRHRGVGRTLFTMVEEKVAKESFAHKIYIQSGFSRETQRFYTSLGCVPARWISKEILARDPRERQMEFNIRG
ncbi:MAG: GNAT family N-acetyltransferase [Turicibacter sp.]|nr:GNAT family N-acetyltransferase [Turicibacter sp.]